MSGGKPFFSAAARSKITKRVAQAVLGRRPLLRQLLARIDFQGAAVSGHRLVKQLGALGALALTALGPRLGRQRAPGTRYQRSEQVAGQPSGKFRYA
jgi:hypothetical protein